MQKRNIILRIFFYISLLLNIALSNNNVFASVDAECEEILPEVEQYLNNIKSIKSEFSQIAPGGEVSEGVFYLKRPGKMKIKYKKPNLLITVNGNVLAYEDQELEEISYIRTNTTPASLLTRKNISFSAKDIELTRCEFLGKNLVISVLKKNQKDAGEFSLVFSKNPIKFVKMQVTSNTDEIYKINLVNTQFDVPLEDSLFIVKNKNLPD